MTEITVNGRLQQYSAEMCSILAIGDLHFKDSNASMMNLFIEKLLTQLRSLIPLPDSIVLLGDTLDRFNDVKATTLCRATAFIHRLLEIVPRVYLLIGNHDRRNNDVFLTEEHPFVGHKTIPGLKVVDTPCTDMIKGQRFIFVPYVHVGRFAEALKEQKLEGCRALFAHQEFRGAVNKEDGDEWSLSAPLVISGHIHDYGRLQSNVIYVGTPLQHTFKESPDKSVSLFSFPTEGSFHERRIYLTLPVRMTFDLKVGEIESFVLPAGKNDIRIIIHCTQSEKKAVMLMEKVRVWRVQGVKIQCKLSDEAQETVLALTTVKEYRRSLAMRVARDAALRELYQELIGSLPIAKVVINIAPR